MWIGTWGVFCVQGVQDRMGLMGGEGFRVGIYVYEDAKECVVGLRLLGCRVCRCMHISSC